LSPSYQSPNASPNVSQLSLSKSNSQGNSKNAKAYRNQTTEPIYEKAEEYSMEDLVRTDASGRQHHEP